MSITPVLPPRLQYTIRIAAQYSIPSLEINVTSVGLVTSSAPSQRVINFPSGRASIHQSTVAHSMHAVKAGHCAARLDGYTGKRNLVEGATVVVESRRAG